MSTDNMEPAAEREGKGLGAAFFLSTLAGALLIYFNGDINLDYALYLPTGVVALYAGIIALALPGIKDRDQAEHHIDSVYFLGFLFTLVSLVSLFAGFSTASAFNGTESIFRYLGISVSTSIAGVLFRNIIRGSHLALLARQRAVSEEDTPEHEPENAQQLLSLHSDSLVTMKESLGRFIEATEGFSSSLNSSREILGRQMESFKDCLAESEEGMRRMSEMSHALSLSAGEMDRFSRGTGELNVVLDGLLEILEEKVEKLA
jgi:methyl-accepting chemotaxis protein